MNEKILSILTEIRPDSDFSNSENFIDEFLLDSFDIINLASALEEEFAVKFNGDDIVPENFASVNTIADLITRIKK